MSANSSFFFLIEGIGSATAIPLKVWSRAANRISKRSSVKKLYRTIAKRDPSKESLKQAKLFDGGIT